jgi:hypothetical protein
MFLARLVPTLRLLGMVLSLSKFNMANLSLQQKHSYQEWLTFQKPRSRSDLSLDKTRFFAIIMRELCYQHRETLLSFHNVRIYWTSVDFHAKKKKNQKNKAHANSQCRESKAMWNSDCTGLRNPGDAEGGFQKPSEWLILKSESCWVESGMLESLSPGNLQGTGCEYVL